MATFRFRGRYIAWDEHTRWDRATPVSVLAATKGEAQKKLWAMLGRCEAGYHWRVYWDSIDEVEALGASAEDVEARSRGVSDG